MPLTYDQKSEIRMAFDEAYVPADRRRALRVTYRADAQIAPWRRHEAGDPFPVRIEDFSPSGVGVIHTEMLPLGAEFLLRVPRPDLPELVVLLSVVRCKPLEDGTFHVGMELSSVMDKTDLGHFYDALQSRKRLTSRRTKILLLTLGIVGLGMSLLIN